MDATPDGISLAMADGVIARHNTPALTMLGLPSGQQMPRGVDEMVHKFRLRHQRDGPLMNPKDLPFVRALDGEVALAELWATRVDSGKDLFIRSIAAPIVVDGRALGAVSVSTDLTQMLQLQQRGQELSAKISHELRTPLSAILGWVRVLERSPPDAGSLSQGIAAIARNAQAQAQLIEKLLDMRRIEIGQLRLEEMGEDAAALTPMRVDGVTVLLIDDEPDMRETTAHLLRDAGARVLSASNAIDGLAMLQEHRPHVVLSDIGMPGNDGYDLMRWVRALPDLQVRHTPAAAITAYAGAEDRRQALLAGYQRYLVKPVRPGELVVAVAELARVHQAPPGR
jgi:CheY-like chemotaxis protein